MPLTRNHFSELEKAPSVIEEISFILRRNTDKAYSFEEIHRQIFGERLTVADMIFQRVALMILNERNEIDVRRLKKAFNGYELYFAWRSERIF
jgi:hypothetical protein